MNREYKASTPAIRAVFAVAAVLAMLVTAGSIEGLASHYGAESQQMANAKPLVVVRH